MIDFGKNLKRIIEQRGVNQKWLADHAQTTEATISRYIKGVNKSPDVEILVNMAKALDVTVDYLLGVSDIPKFESDTTAEQRILLGAFSRASERDASIIWQILDAYLSPAEKDYLQQFNQDENDTKIG